MINLLPLIVEKTVPYNNNLLLRLGMLYRSVMSSGRMIENLEWTRLEPGNLVHLKIGWLQLTENQLKDISLNYHKGRK